MRYLSSLDTEKTTILKIDLKDKKILNELGKNSRIPLSTLSKNVGLSRDSVKYRIDMLTKRNLIKGYISVVDTKALGYDSYHIFLKLNNPHKDIENQIIKEIKEMDCVRAILKLYGSYDLEIALISKNIQEFDRLLNEIISKTENNIISYETLIISKNIITRVFPKKFIEAENSPVELKKNEVLLDKKDKQLIKVIRDDARLSLLDISEKIKISPDAVSYRLKKLNGSLIKKYIPIINYNIVGYQVSLLLMNIKNLSTEKEKLLSKIINEDKNILWAVKTIGKYNLLAYVCFDNQEDLQKTIIKIRTSFPEQILDHENLLAYAEYKYTYAPDCIFENESLIKSS